MMTRLLSSCKQNGIETAKQTAAKGRDSHFFIERCVVHSDDLRADRGLCTVEQDHAIPQHQCLAKTHKLLGDDRRPVHARDGFSGSRPLGIKAVSE